MRVKTMTFAGLFTLALAAASAAAPVYEVDPAHSEVGFQIRHLVGKVRGRFTEFTGRVDGDAKAPAVEFKIKSASIDTGAADRDKHLRTPDFFDVAKYPEITFKSEKVVEKAKGEYEVTGPLTMHGVTKTVILPVKVTGPEADPWGNQRTGFEIQTTLNRKDYGIVWNKTLDSGGIMLGDDVTVNINLEAVAKPDASAKPAEKK
jgi:polyisoprenoid-binding protein YceI